MRTLLTTTGLVVAILALTIIIGSLGETLYTVFTLEDASSSGALRLSQAHWDKPLSPATRRVVRTVPGVADTLTALQTRLADPEEQESGFQLTREQVWAMDSYIPGLDYGPPPVPSPLLLAVLVRDRSKMDSSLPPLNACGSAENAKRAHS